MVKYVSRNTVWARGFWVLSVLYCSIPIAEKVINGTLQLTSLLLHNGIVYIRKVFISGEE